MANTTFPNIDFRFRRGTKEGYENTQYLEGSLNFTKDEEMMYVHKDGLMFRISDIVLNAGTEAQIRTIEFPKAKLYLASDTMRLMWFERTNLEWRYINEIAKYAESATIAIKDANGNTINAYYYPKSEALADYDTLSNRIEALSSEVSGIVRFDAVVCNSINDLPPIGEKGTIYLIPISNYYDDYTPESNDDLDTHVELIYVFTEEYGGFYEVIGNTTVSFDNYYTKAEVDTLLNNLRTEFQDEMSNLRSQVESTINGLRTTLNSFMASTNNKFSLIDQQISTINININALGSRVTTLEQKESGAEGDIDALEQELDQFKTDTTNNFSDVNNTLDYIKEYYSVSEQGDEGTT